MENVDRQIVTVERALQPGETDAMGPHAGKGSQELQRLHRLMRGRYLIAIFLSLILAAGGAYIGFRCGGKTYQSIGMLRVKPVVQKILYPVEELRGPAGIRRVRRCPGGVDSKPGDHGG